MLVALSPVWSRTVGDSCEIVIKSDLSKDKDQVVNITIPKNCQFGHVAWSYPLGSAFMPYTDGNKAFQLCIEEEWASELSRVQGLVDGQYKDLPLPTKGTPACTKSCDGHAALLISAPTDLNFLSSFNYRIIEEKSTLFLVSSETGYGDPCTATDFEINGPFDANHNALNLTILNDCTNGSVYWNYPEGTAILSAKRPDTVFDLCIESSWATVLEGVDVKTGTADGKLQVPTKVYKA
ncbi:hypothetical protein Btru_042347 [Bulinus truncatus]|nr:hypothetical protein Btru_042347 [Bulinus truncatus]